MARRDFDCNGDAAAAEANDDDNNTEDEEDVVGHLTEGDVCLLLTMPLPLPPLAFRAAAAPALNARTQATERRHI